MARRLAVAGGPPESIWVNYNEGFGSAYTWQPCPVPRDTGETSHGTAISQRQSFGGYPGN